MYVYSDAQNSMNPYCLVHGGGMVGVFCCLGAWRCCWWLQIWLLYCRFFGLATTQMGAIVKTLGACLISCCLLHWIQLNVFGFVCLDVAWIALNNTLCCMAIVVDGEWILTVIADGAKNEKQWWFREQILCNIEMMDWMNGWMVGQVET